MARIGIHYAYWGTEWEVDLCERVRKAAKAGFDVIEITPPAYFPEMNLQKMDELKKCALDNGIEMSYCIGFPKHLDMASEDEQVRKEGIAYTQNMLRAISHMGGKILSGILYSYWPYDYSTPPADKQAAWERALRSVRETVKTAEDLGITYAIEMVNRFEQFLLNSVEEGLTFLEQVDSPNCKILLDVFHMNIEEDDPAQAIRKAGNSLAHFHISQNNRKVPMPDGGIAWEPIAQALREIDFSGRIVMEPFVLPGGPVAQDIKIFRPLAEDTSEEGLERELAKGLAFARSVF